MPAKSTLSKSAPVKVSGRLVSEAKAAAAIADRSLAAQIEHWSRIGREVEQVLPHKLLMQIKESDAGNLTAEKRQSLARALLEAFNSSDRAVALAAIQTNADPVYEADPTKPGRIRQVWADGRRISGSLVGRQFVAEPDLEA